MWQAVSAPQSIGGVLDTGFKLFRACFTRGFMLAAVMALLSAPFGILSQWAAAQASGVAVSLVAVGAVVLIVLVLIFTSGLILLIDSVANERPLKIGSALAIGARRGPALFGSGVLYTLAVAGGFVLLVLPGIFLAVMLTFCWFTVVVERIGPVESLRRSWRLVRGHWWRMAAIVTIIGIIVGVLYVILGFVIGITLTNPEQLSSGVAPWYIDFVVTPVLSGVATPLGYSLGLAAYYDLKIRYEGTDIAERIAAATA